MPRPVAIGSPRPSSNSTTRRSVVDFDEETFFEIRRQAEHSRTSFAEMVRRLVEFGLEDQRQINQIETNHP